MPIRELVENDEQIYHVHYSTKDFSAGSTIKHFRSEHDYHAAKHICKIDLKKFPHIKFEALKEYDLIVQKYAEKNKNFACDEFPIRMYEDVNPMYYVEFELDESLLIESIFLTNCRRILTITDRHPDSYFKYDKSAPSRIKGSYGQKFVKMQGYWEKTLHGDGSMHETCPHHVGTHLPGMRPASQNSGFTGGGGAHRHMVLPHPMTDQQITKVISSLCKHQFIGGFPKTDSKPFKGIPNFTMKTNVGVLQKEAIEMLTTLRDPLQPGGVVQEHQRQVEGF